MIWLSFGKWNHKAGPLFVWDRAYLSLGRWTPIIFGKPRYKGM